MQEILGDLNVKRGDDWVRKLIFTDELTGLPVDITDWTVFFTVKANKDDADVDAIFQLIWTATLSSDADPALGETVLRIPKASTDSKTPGYYWYDVQLKNLGGEIFTPYVGRFNLQYDISRSTS